MSFLGCDLWHVFFFFFFEIWEILRFQFLPFLPLFSPMTPPTSSQKTTYPRNHYDKRAPITPTSGFYLALVHRGPPPPPLSESLACVTIDSPGLKDLHTWHLLSKGCHYHLEELWHQHNEKGSGSTFSQTHGKMRCKLYFTTLRWSVLLLNWLFYSLLCHHDSVTGCVMFMNYSLVFLLCNCF